MTGASFITPNFLLPYSSQASDYRCAVNAAGGAVVFERTVFKSAGGSGKSQLYLLDLTQSGATPTSSCKISRSRFRTGLTGPG